MVLYLKLPLYHLGYPAKGPQIRGESGRSGPSPENLRQTLFLASRQARGTARMGLGARSFYPLLLEHFFFQRETEAGETPTRRLTSRTPLPAWSNRTAIIRRISRASALPLGRILLSSPPAIGGIYSIQNTLLWQGEDQYNSYWKICFGAILVNLNRPRIGRARQLSL
jgi:hypothetical protein